MAVSQASPEAGATPGTPPLSPQSGQDQSHGGGSMLTYSSLNDNQRALYDTIIDDIRHDREVKYESFLKSGNTKAVLTTSDHHLIYRAVTSNKPKSVKSILNIAQKIDILKNLLTAQQFGMSGTGQDTLLELARSIQPEDEHLKGKNRLVIQIIEQKMKEAGLEVPAQQSQTPVTGGQASPEAEPTPDTPPLSPQGGQDQSHGEGSTGNEQQKTLIKLVKLASKNQVDTDEFIKELKNAQNNNFDFHATKLTDCDGLDKLQYEGKSIVTIILERHYIDDKIVDALFNEKILTEEGTLTLLKERVALNTNLLDINGHFVESAIKHITSSNTQDKKDIAKRVIRAIHNTLLIIKVDKSGAGNITDIRKKISDLEKIVKSLELLKSDEYIKENIDQFHIGKAKVLQTMQSVAMRTPDDQYSQPPVDAGNPASQGVNKTPGTPSLSPQGAQHQQYRTDGSNPRRTSVPFNSSDDKSEHHGNPKSPTFLDKLSEHKWKIAVGTVGTLLLIGSGIAFALGQLVIGVIVAVAVTAAVGILAKKVHAEYKGQGVNDKSVPKAIESVLSDMLPGSIEPHKAPQPGVVD